VPVEGIAQTYEFKSIFVSGRDLTGYGMKEIQRLGKNLHTTLALACRVPDLKEYGDGRRT